jgi:hypothetical protein
MRFFTWAGLVAVMAVITTSAAWAQGGKPGPLGGLWKGQLPLLGGKLDMTVSIVPLAGGSYFAALDVPAAST